MNSMWVKAKQQDRRLAVRDVLFDFNVGFIFSAVLAVLFLGLGVLVQFGSGEPLEMAGGAYIPQLMSMYGDAIGAWAVPLMAVIAFGAIFGTVVTVIDGYARLCGESVRLLRGTPDLARRDKDFWILGIAAVALVTVLFMSDSLSGMLRFAMISAFLTAPVFAWLNFSLVRGQHHLSPTLRWLSWAGMVFLVGFGLLFLLNVVGLLG